MKNYIILFLLILVGIYVPSGWVSPGWLVFIKTILFFGIIYLLYDQYNYSSAANPYDGDERLKLHRSEDKDIVKPVIPQKSKKLYSGSIQISTLLNLSESNLNAFLVGEFEILYNYLMPKHGFLLVQEADKKLFLFYSHVNDILDNPRGESFVSLINILSRMDDEILVENNLDGSSNIIQIYEGTPYSPGSLFAMKTALPDDQFLYWIFDTPGSGFFNSEELSVPVQINLLAYNTVVQSIEKFLINKQLTLVEEEKKLFRSLNAAATLDETINILVDEISAIFEAQKLTVAFVDKDAKYPQTARIVKTIGYEEPSKNGFKFNIEEGLAGRVIKNKKVYLMDDIDKGDYFIPRFSKNEKTNYNLHAFLGCPIMSKDESFLGMISLEHRTVGQYSAEDRELLIKYCSILNETLGRFKADPPK